MPDWVNKCTRYQKWGNKKGGMVLSMPPFLSELSRLSSQLKVVVQLNHKRVVALPVLWRGLIVRHIISQALNRTQACL